MINSRKNRIIFIFAALVIFTQLSAVSFSFVSAQTTNKKTTGKITKKHSAKTSVIKKKIAAKSVRKKKVVNKYKRLRKQTLADRLKVTKKKSGTYTTPLTEIGTEVSKLPIISATTQVNLEELKKILPTAEKKQITLINFWATWCVPCREEFPDLVKIDAEFRAKGVEFFIVSLDDVTDIKTEVPKFLRQMKSTMPSYLLKTPDEEAAIVEIAPNWSGGLPFTVLFDETGKQVYLKQGIIKLDVLRAEINKLLVAADTPK